MVEGDASVRMDDVRVEDHVSPAGLRYIVSEELKHLVRISLTEFTVACCVEVEEVRGIGASA